jgi:hypothetical protein
LKATVLREALLALFLLMVSSSPAPATHELEPEGSNCGAWTKLRAQGGDHDDVLKGWVMGYLSGISAGTQRDFLEGIDPSSISDALDIACRGTPLDDLGTAVAKIAVYLIDRNRHR